MKKVLILFLLAFGAERLQAQNVGVGQPAPQQKLDVNGAIRIGTTAAGVAGSIRYNAGVFEGYNGSSWVAFGSGNGTVTSIATGTGLTGGPITGSGSISLANTAVTPGVYGSATSVGSFTVDAQGRITSAANTTISGVAPGGAAGGDLTGTYPNPTIANSAVTTAKILDGTITNADIANGTINLTQKVTGVLPIANGGTNTNAIGAPGTVPYSNGTAYAFTGVGTAGYVLRSNGAAAPTWVDPNTTITKRDVTTGGNGITVGNGTGQVVGAANLTVDVATNSAASPGVLPAGAGNANRAWGTDAAGNPAWGQINTNQILDGTIATADIANNAVDGTKINLTGNATGDIMYYDGTDWVRLPAGTAGYKLQTNGAAAPTWAVAPGGSGTTNYLARWTNATTLGTGVSFDNGTNVGIGTTTPARKLDVYGAAGNYPARVGSPDGYLDFGPANTGWSHFSTDRPRFYFNVGITVDQGLIGSYSQDLQLQTSGTTRITALNSNGNVGIGTAGPGYRLHVMGDIYANGGWFRVSGNQGLYWESWGGGFYMSDGTWIRTYGGRNFYCDATIQAGTNMYSPIYYDLNNGGYYTDPNGTTNLWYLAVNGGANFSGTVNTNTWGTGFTGYGRINTNADNVTGGGITVSDDGGIFDYNDGWLTMLGSYGLRLRSGQTTNLMYLDMNDGGGLRDKYILSSNNAWGYVGINGRAYYYMYSYNFVNPSLRELKRNIMPVSTSASLYNHVMADIDKIQPSFYKYKNETDQPTDQLTKYRPNMHLGLLLDETPDYIQDNSFSGVDIYSLGALNLAGVKYLRSEMQTVQKQLENGTVGGKIQDFGSQNFTGNEVNITFDANFIQNLNGTPVVTVTPNLPNVQLYVTNKTEKGFTVKISGNAPTGLSFDWIALGKTQTGQKVAEIAPLDPALKEQLVVSPEKKAVLQKHFETINNELDANKPGSRMEYNPGTSQVAPTAPAPAILLDQAKPTNVPNATPAKQ